MKKRTEILRKIAAPVMGLVVAGATMLTPMSAMAASSNVSGKLNGYACSSYVTIDTRDAYAVTSFSRGGSVIKAKVVLYTKLNGKWKKHSNSNSSTAGGTSAKASVDSGAELTQYAEGTHYVSYDTYSWSDNTYVHY